MPLGVCCCCLDFKKNLALQCLAHSPAAFFIFSAQADDDEDIVDIVDPKEELVEVCNKEEAVTAKWNEYMACADRIAAKGTECLLIPFFLVG